MLQLIIVPVEEFDESISGFVWTKEYTLQLEHSLVSLSKWESKWEKPFLSKADQTIAESIDYIRCMTMTQNVDPKCYNYISKKNIDEVSRYINLPMSATKFAKDDKKTINRETVTAEIIYYWMIALQIPFECQKWHLNKLLTLINVCNIKNQPAKKMSQKELLSRNRALNEARKQQLKTSG